jgi:hypothetical protein
MLGFDLQERRAISFTVALSSNEPSTVDTNFYSNELEFSRVWRWMSYSYTWNMNESFSIVWKKAGTDDPGICLIHASQYRFSSNLRNFPGHSVWVSGPWVGLNLVRAMELTSAFLALGFCDICTPSCDTFYTPRAP